MEIKSIVSPRYVRTFLQFSCTYFVTIAISVLLNRLGTGLGRYMDLAQSSLAAGGREGVGGRVG